MTLDGVHAIAHVTRKVRRDPFPMATYVFVANQLHLPKGLSNVTLDGHAEQRGDDVRLEHGGAEHPVRVAASRARCTRYMGGGAIYRGLSKIEAKHPGVAIPSTSRSR